MLVSSLDQLKALWGARREAILEDYKTFLCYKSVSSEPEYRQQVLACADWVAEFLRTIHFEVDLWSTPGYPVIFAQNLKAGPDKPTLLIYNHYDVQPVDPIELWKSPPFTPTEENGEIYARGAQDNKGQCMYVLQALKALMEEEGQLPINVKLCIEGEEECGSAGISAILPKHKEALKADYLAIVDLGLERADTPALTLGLRGLITLDLEVTGTKGDLHSGSHGGLAYNPNHALAALLAGVRDDKGKIIIPGFYDDCLPPSEDFKKQLSMDLNVTEYEQLFGAKPTGGERDLPLRVRSWLRPTFEVNGMNGGYSGAGFKTVIPAKAIAKISCRLVPGQDPHKIGQLVKDYFEKRAPEGIKVQVHVHSGGGKAVVTLPDSPIIQAFANAYQQLFNKPCQYISSGATIPIVTELAETSGAEVVMLGFGLPGDNIHAPNEHFGIDRLEKGFLAICLGLQLLGSKT